jgi:hypothetical protein
VLVDVRIVERFDSFGGTSKEHIARHFQAYGVNLFAQRPD